MKKKVLLTGILSIVMCLSLIAGATFALFTSESKVNIAVTSGNVEVVAYVDVDSVEYKALQTPTWTKAQNGVATFDNLGGSAVVTKESVVLTNVLPGDAIKFNVKIENKSTVNVKTRTLIENVLSEDTGLFGALEVNVDNAEFNGAIVTDWAVITPDQGNDTIPVEIAFPKDAGNAVQGKTCKIDILVEAVQGNAEVKNSFNENEDGTYSITDKYGLISFQKSVNAGEKFTGKTVILENDIDLAYTNWTPIASNADNHGNVGFFGTFDGNGKTISNLYVKQDPAYRGAGFFGALRGTVKNLTIADAYVENYITGSASTNGTAVVTGSTAYGATIDGVKVIGAEVIGNRYVAGIAGYVDGTITNCYVQDIILTATPDDFSGSFDNGDKVGGIAGYLNSGDDTVTNNTVKNLTGTAYRDLGGIVGCANLATNTVTGNKVEGNINLTIDQVSKSYGKKDPNAKAIVGRIDGGTLDASNVDNSAFAVTVKAEGIAVVNNVIYSSFADAAAAAVVNGDTIQLGYGTYNYTDKIQGKTLTIKGLGNDTKLNMTSAWNVGDATLTFEDLYIEGVNSNSGNGYGIQHTTNAIKYINCTINNSFTNEFNGTVEYNGCTFTGTFYIWTYSVKEAKFIGCTFDKEDSRAILVYSHGNNPLNVLVKDCTFKAKAKGYTGVPAWTAAIEVDTTFITTAGTSVVIENCTYNDQFSNIVRDKSSASAVPAVITVDGVLFASTIAQVTDLIEKNDNVTIELADGNYTSNFKVEGGKEVTIVGSKDVVLDGQIATTSSTEGVLYIKGITINVDDKIVDSTGISQTGKSAIAIWGNQTVICEDVTFNMTLANSTAITSWWDTGVGTTIIVRNCTFNCNGQRPIRATGNVTVENCTFNDPYRYAVQLTAKASTATLLDKAIINFNNNTIVNGVNGKAFVYGVQLEGADYGCNNLVINGAGNTIENGGADSAMYYCECGKVDHATIEWNVETTPVHEV